MSQVNWRSNHYRPSSLTCSSIPTSSEYQSSRFLLSGHQVRRWGHLQVCFFSDKVHKGAKCDYFLRLGLPFMNMPAPFHNRVRRKFAANKVESFC